jgi:hypothetical protein
MDNMSTRTPIAARRNGAGSRIGSSFRAIVGSATLVLLAFSALPQPVAAQVVATDTGLRGLQLQRSGLKSVYDLRWDKVVRQKLDVGCGAASLATILTYHYDFAATEQEIADALWADVARGHPSAQLKQRVDTVGFSLANIRNVAEKGGLVSAGFRVDAKDLDKLRIPTITQVTIRGFAHFVVVRGAQNGRVFVADPRFGNTSYRLAAFEKIWSGVMLGFAARGAKNAPAGDVLSVKADEKAGTSLDVAMRSPRLRDVPLDQFSSGSSFRVSTFPFVSPQISGLQSVFPTFIGRRVEF